VTTTVRRTDGNPEEVYALPVSPATADFPPAIAMAAEFFIENP
jgi:hypothetical protein